MDIDCLMTQALYAYTDFIYCNVVSVFFKYSTLLAHLAVFFFHQSLIVYIIPGRPGIRGMRTAIPDFPGIKNHVWEH